MSGNINPGADVPGGSVPQAGAPPDTSHPAPMAYPPPIGYSGVNPSGPNRPRKRESRSSWGGVLVFACLAIGFLASGLQLTRERLKDEQTRANQLNTTTVFVEAQSENVGRLMADPQTVLIRLTGPAGSGVHHASLAWNAVQSRGALFCDALPLLDASRRYELYGFAKDGEPMHLGEIQGRPGTGVYTFRAEPQNGQMPADSISQFEITAGPRIASHDPVLAGSIPSANALGGP
jgi:hypothetical protein